MLSLAILRRQVYDARALGHNAPGGQRACKNTDPRRESLMKTAMLTRLEHEFDDEDWDEDEEEDLPGTDEEELDFDELEEEDPDDL